MNENESQSAEEKPLLPPERSGPIQKMYVVLVEIEGTERVVSIPAGIFGEVTTPLVGEQEDSPQLRAMLQELADGQGVAIYYREFVAGEKLFTIQPNLAKAPVEGTVKTLEELLGKAPEQK